MHPDYLHVLLNPIPVYGLAMGLLGLVVAFALRSRHARAVALVILCLSSASAWPVWHYGEKAYDDVMMLTDDDGTKWMDEHRSRAEKTIACFYVLAALSLAALLVPLKKPRTEIPLSLASLILAVAVLAIGGWIAYAGGRIRHQEFRAAPAPGPLRKAMSVEAVANTIRVATLALATAFFLSRASKAAVRTPKSKSPATQVSGFNPATPRTSLPVDRIGLPLVNHDRVLK